MIRKTFMFFLSLCFVTSAQSAEVTISAGVPVVVSLAETISSSASKTGDIVQMIVVGDVIVDDVVVIKSGSPIIGAVEFAEASDFAGQSGKIVIGASSAIAVDGTTVPISGSKTFEGEDEIIGTVVVSALICPLGLVNKGDEAAAGVHTQFRAVVLAPVRVTI